LGKNQDQVDRAILLNFKLSSLGCILSSPEGWDTDLAKVGPWLLPQAGAEKKSHGPVQKLNFSSEKT
jgi:hypothetical protein